MDDTCTSNTLIPRKAPISTSCKCRCSHCLAFFLLTHDQLGRFLVNTTYTNGNKPYRCSLCGKSFSQEIIESVKGICSGGISQVSLQCGHCEKSFSRNDDHTHDQGVFVKLYKCSKCNKNFLGMATQTEDKSFQCDKCVSATIKSNTITHTEEKPYQCGYCNKAFSTSENFKVHMGTHSEAIYDPISKDVESYVDMNTSFPLVKQVELCEIDIKEEDII